MQPATRNQKNFMDPAHHERPTYAPGPDKAIEDLTIQSQAPDADVNMILARFGIGEPRALAYGTTDTALDLQDALDTIARARRTWAEMPEAIRKNFNNYRDLIAAIERGDVEIRDGTPPGPPTEEEELAAIEAAERRDNLREAARVRKLKELGALPPDFKKE